MDMLDRLHDLETLVDTARAMPLSQSCLVPREEALALIDSVRDAMPESLREAELVLRRRDEILTEATRTADLMIESARQEVEEMRLSGENAADQIVSEAQRTRERVEVEAQQVMGEARAQAELMVDSHSISVAAHDEAARIMSEARQRAEQLLSETRARAARSIENAQAAMMDGVEDLRRGVAALRVDVPVIVEDRAAAPEPTQPVTSPAGEADSFFDIDASGGLEGYR